RWLVRMLWGLRAYNTEVLNTPGPVLLVPNHVSWLDWLFLFVWLDDDWKCVVSATSAETSWIHRKIMLNRRTFPIDTNSPYAVKRMAEFLAGNGRLVLFAEGRLSRTGTLMKLFDGTGFLLHKTHAKVITCHLRGAYRLPLSPNRDQHFWFPRVSIHFSDVHIPPQLEQLTTSQSRTVFTNWLRDRMADQQFATEMEFGPRTLPEAILDSARLRPRHVALLDVTAEIPFRKLRIAADVLGRQFDRVLPPEQKRIGVVLPNVNATPVALLALWESGRVP